MRVFTQGHKGTLKWMTINLAPDLYQATRSKKLDRTRPDHIAQKRVASSREPAARNFPATVRVFEGV